MNDCLVCPHKEQCLMTGVATFSCSYHDLIMLQELSFRPPSLLKDILPLLIHLQHHTMKLFSLTQFLFGFYHEQVDGKWVRMRNGRRLYPGDRHHPDTYRRPRHKKGHPEYELFNGPLPLQSAHKPDSRPSSAQMLGKKMQQEGKMHNQGLCEPTARQPLFEKSVHRKPSLNRRPPPRRTQRSSTPSSTASTLVATPLEQVGEREREHSQPEAPQHRPAAFVSTPAPTIQPPVFHHAEAVNPLIGCILANPNRNDTSIALSRLQSLAFLVFPIMGKFNLHVGRLMELDESVTAVNSWNSGHGQEIRIKVRSFTRPWRSMDEMVDLMLNELAHNVSSRRGKEWCALRNQFMLEYRRRQGSMYPFPGRIWCRRSWH